MGKVVLKYEVVLKKNYEFKNNNICIYKSPSKFACSTLFIVYKYIVNET